MGCGSSAEVKTENKLLDKIVAEDPQEIDFGDEEIKQVCKLLGNQKYFEGGKLYSLPDGLKNCQNLKKLTIGTNSFKKIPEVIFELTSLEELEISSGEITEMSPDITKLTNLKTLLLYGNKITAIPPEIGQMTNLIDLNLFNNKLKGAKAIPEEINNLTSLEQLNLGDNSFMQFPCIDKLVNLQELKFQWGKVFRINGSWENLSSLKVIMASKNRLQELPTLPPGITTLDINGNMVKSSECVAKCTNLEELFLNENGIDDLPPGVFTDKLTLLKADKNNLTKLPDEIGNCSNLTGIFLNDNKLEDLNPSILKCTKLIRAGFKGNSGLAGNATAEQLKDLVTGQTPPGTYWG